MGDAGFGMFGSLLGVFAMLIFLFLACQLLIGLYATSVVQATAADAARAAARIDATSSNGQDQDSIAAQVSTIEAQARAALGPMGEDANFEWAVDDDTISVQIAADPPSFVPARLSNGDWKAITRRAVVRREQLIDLVSAETQIQESEE